MSDGPQKQLWNQILSNTHERLSKSTEELRKDIATKLGQIYIFDPNALKQTLIEFYTGAVKNYKPFGNLKGKQENITFPEGEFNKLVKNCEALARDAELRTFKRFKMGTAGRQRLKDVKRVIRGKGQGGELPLPVGATAYVFSSYRQAVNFHNSILKGKGDSKGPIGIFLENNILKQIKDENVKTTLREQYNTSILNVGHGASVGASVSALQSIQELKDATFKGATGGLTQEQQNALNALKDSTILQYSKVGLSTQAIDTTLEQQYFTNIIKNFYIDEKGIFNADYISVLSLQSTWDNNIDSKTESQIKSDVLSQLQKLKDDVLLTEGSDSLLQGIEKVLFYSSSNKLKNYKNIKIKGKSSRKYRSVNKFNVSHKASSKLKSGKTQKAQKVTPNFKNAPKSQAPMLAKPEVESPSPLQVVAYINTRLQQKIEKNMIPPALESRTGRFSGSVKVLNMLQTRKGFPSFEYTYDKNPYQVFEMGVGRQPWATVDRDPRKLIDKSIREIAAEMLQGRLYTRRV
jgi:hypothetical protein